VADSLSSAKDDGRAVRKGSRALASLLHRAERLYGSRPAVSCAGKTWTYAQFAERVRRLVGVLADAGVGPGAPLAMLHRNCHCVLEAYFASAALDTLFVPLNHRLTQADIAAILADSGACCLISEPCFMDKAEAAVRLLPEPGHPRVLRSGGGPVGLEGLMEATSRGALTTTHAGSDTPAHLYYTSGTTGKPKGVILTHGNVLSHAEAAIAELELSENDVWLHAAPLFHLADAWATWAITAVGGRHVLLAEFAAPTVFDTIAAEGVTITNLVPTMLVGLVNHPTAVPEQLRTMRYILSGGSPMPPELLKKIEALFPCEYVQTYGLTETSPYLTLSLLTDELRRLPPAEQHRYRASTGRPMRGVEVKVVDEQGREVAWDGRTVGEIIARGPTVSPGYYHRPEETAQAYRDGWLHTGDLAYVEQPGYLTIVDRLKDVINTGGEQVYSTEVENVLHAHAAVKEVAVFAVPHEQWGEAVWAVTVLREGESVAGTELVEFCRERLAPFKVPQGVEFVDALPLMGSGKVDKKVLREPYWAGEQKRVR